MQVGRSPDADKIYNQYVAYFSDINAKIHMIDELPSDKWNQPNVQQDRISLLASQQKLGPIYQTDYNDTNATLASFQSDCSEIENKVTAAFNDAMGGNSPIQQQIQADNTSAQNIMANLTPKINQDQASLNSAPNLQATLASLQQQIDALSPGAQKDKAQNDLNAAIAELESLQSAIGQAQPSWDTLQNECSAITMQGGILDQLNALAAKADPVQADLDQANTLLAIVLLAESDLNTFESSNAMTAVNGTLSLVKQEIQAVQRDIQPTPLPGKIEHSCWYIDWTSRDFPIPQGVTVVNIFVGTLTLINGQPSLNGFGAMSLDDLDAFVQKCSAQNPPIAVRASVGGGGGSYDNCWDLLTQDNVGAFARGLADFCHTHGLRGIDFDYEEYKSQEQEILVGTLIREFKAIDSNLQTSLCTNAGFGPNYPWQAVVKNIFDAAVDPATGKCAIDRLNIMSYYQPMDQEEAWVNGWSIYMQQNYGLSPSQIIVGIDDFDAKAYDIGAFSTWAASQGFSTGYWAWNPATQAASDQSSLKILNSYNLAKANPVAKTKKAAGELTFGKAALILLAALLGPITLIILGILLLFGAKEEKNQVLAKRRVLPPRGFPKPSAPPAHLMNF